jgi:hypothetical protein
VIADPSRAWIRRAVSGFLGVIAVHGLFLGRCADAVRGLNVARGSVVASVVVATLGLTATPALAKDRPLPTSTAMPPAYANASTFEVPYTASKGPGASAPAQVDLYAKAPGDVIYSLAGTDTTPETPSLSYHAGAGDGRYAFYTVAVDQLGNTEAPPLLGDDGGTVVDTVAPTSVAAAPATVANAAIGVGYAAEDSGGSGVASVELWAKAPNASSYSLALTDDTPESPSFSYLPASGDGTYSFATVAVDRAGNREPAPLAADTETAYSGPAPGFSGTVVVTQIPAQPSAPSLPLVAALVRSPKQTLKQVVANGIKFRLYAYRPLSLTLSAALTPRSARNLGLRRHPVIASRRYQFAEAGIYQLRLRLNHEAAPRLRRARAATFTLRTVVGTATGRVISNTRIKLRN